MKKLIKIFTSALIAGAMLCTTLATPASIYKENNKLSNSQTEVKAVIQPYNAILADNCNFYSISGNGKKLYSKPIGTVIAVLELRYNYCKVSKEEDQWVNKDKTQKIPESDAIYLNNHNHNNHISNYCPIITKTIRNDRGQKFIYLDDKDDKPFNGTPANNHYIRIERVMEFRRIGDIKLAPPNSKIKSSAKAYFDIDTYKYYVCPICHYQLLISIDHKKSVPFNCWTESLEELARKANEGLGGNIPKGSENGH